MNDKQNALMDSFDGDLTPEQAAELLELGEGDTGELDTPDDVVAPDATADRDQDTPEGDDDTGGAGTNDDDTAATAEANGGDAGGGGEDEPGQDTPSDDELNADNAVVLAKDGKHTISYDKLKEARDGMQHWKAQAEQAQARLDTLQQEAQERADAGKAPTKVDNQVVAAQAAIDEGVDPEIFGDFSEEALAKGIQTLIDTRIAAKVEAVLQEKLAPLEEKQATSEAEAHYKAIYEAHPDADSLVESQELSDWIADQPSYVQKACAAVLNDGTAPEIIELFDRFKQATGRVPDSADTKAEPDKEAVRAAAKAAVDNAKPAVPSSLSDIPGGRPAGQTREEQMAELNGQELLDAMQEGNMSPERIEEFLNSL